MERHKLFEIEKEINELEYQISIHLRLIVHFKGRLRSDNIGSKKASEIRGILNEANLISTKNMKRLLELRELIDCENYPPPPPPPSQPLKVYRFF